MDITINTPALLFPAISLVMLAYTNRFMALSTVVRKLHDEYQMDNRQNKNLHLQIKNLQYRIKLVRRMQFFGVMSFLFALLSMFLIFINELNMARLVFITCTIMFAISLIISLTEIMRSTKALELELSDMEGLDDNTILNYFKKKYGGR